MTLQTPFLPATPSSDPSASESVVTLVIGGNGKTGRRVASLLGAAGCPVRLGSRSTPIPFDWDDFSTWRPALTGVRRAYVTYQPDLAFPGAVERIGELVDAAEASGVERLVLLSGRGEPAARAAEDLVLAGDLESAVVRAAFFAQNFSEHFLIDAVLDGVIALPAGTVAEPIIDVDDIAEVAVAALTRPDVQGVVELTGPRLLTFDAMAAELSEACGRRITYLPVTAGQYVEAAVAAYVPISDAEALAELFAFIFDGHNASVTTGAPDVLGRPARDFRAYARSAAATGVWDVPSEGIRR